jgi:hypothetical protein
VTERTATADERANWFFIIGCQRTGTTLMRLVLECHSQIHCCDESSAYNLLRRTASPPAGSHRLLGLKVPCVTEQLADASLWDEWLLRDGVDNDYCGQRLVFMVRDVRDTVSSMRQLHLHGAPWNGAPWIEKSMIPSLRAKIVKSPAFRARYAAEISRLSGARHPSLARAAFYWRYKTDALFDYLDRGFPVLLVRYEDLVRQPQIELLRICGFLQVPWEPQLLSHSLHPHGEVKGDGSTIGGTDPCRGIDTTSVQRWQQTFGAAEIEDILCFAGETQSFLYPAVA